MRAAIYARYSSENQRPESIDDQVRACRELAANRGFTVDPTHIFCDEAKSGALRERPGLEALCVAARNSEFEAVLVDDLSRLSRDNHFLLTLYAELRFHAVRIASRADSLDSDDRHSKLGFQMRGIVNELYLDDLREKTLRGQLGQKARGFSVGEATYGYRSRPVGEMRVDRRGRPRPDGYHMEPYPEEAAVVRRVFEEFASGKALTAIVKDLNADGVPGRRRVAKGWTPSTVSRILKNEKYIGRWVWNRSETRRDPRTGRRRRIPKPRDEWHVAQDESLRIVSQELWEHTQQRWIEIDGTWPGRCRERGFEKQQRSYVETHPRQLLSGMLRCGTCRATMGQVSGKGGGYYGCLGGTKRACTNTLLVPRRLAEHRLLGALRERISDVASLHYILTRVEEEVRRLHGNLPREIKEKRLALASEERRVANFIEFIGEGRGTRALSAALTEAELRAECLRAEIDLLTTTANAMFQAPPLEWVEHRVRALGELLERETARSALLLRRVLGPVRLVATRPEVGRPYYQAQTALQVLDLLQDPDDGSNSLRQWRRGESNPRPKAQRGGSSSDQVSPSVRNVDDDDSGSHLE